MNRRNFFAFLPLAPFVAASSIEAQAKPDISKDAPSNYYAALTLQGKKKSDGTIMHLSADGSTGLGFINMDQPDPNKQVSMAVGEDGNLWLKRKDSEWKRVVTE